ncbi:26S proteasome non-ATPase regulatory subunit 4 [Populus alba x Populus x berolinensis]|nr:26S proteasome non-ATPase regulatory subunit 4 [Populus alba x Populus x berolinensis]
MVLEATMICVDNSEWMRNGDYSPSRFQAQADAVNLLCGAKTQSNPENTVGILTMAGKQVRVLTTLTSDLGKILSCMHGLEVGGEMNLSAGIQVAQLALKHRQNKNQQQRIIVFAGSPIQYDKKMLETIGKKLKKNNVSLDIVDFGEDKEGKPEKLEALFSAVNSNESSHIVHIPPGGVAISDALMSTPVFTGDGEGGSGFAVAAAAAGGGDFDFGVDPNLDPELALALRVSMEEERARQEAAAKRAADEAARQEKGEEPPSNSQDATMVDKAAEATNNASEPMDEVNALLQHAIALSMENSGSDPSVRDSEMAEATNEDQDLAVALQISIQETAKDSSSQSDMSKALEDQSFMSSVVASLPGVDPNDPSVKELLASLQGQSSESEQKKNEDNPPKNNTVHLPSDSTKMAMAFKMATTGMWVTDECKNSFHEMKWRKVHRYIVFKIDEKSRLVTVDKVGGPGEGYDDLAASLPDDDCRYAVFDFDFVTVDNCRKSKIFFIAWAPTASRIRAKMLYATSKDGLRRVLEGVHYELQATDPTEMGFDLIRDRAK